MTWVRKDTPLQWNQLKPGPGEIQDINSHQRRKCQREKELEKARKLDNRHLRLQAQIRKKEEKQPQEEKNRWEPPRGSLWFWKQKQRLIRLREMVQFHRLRHLQHADPLQPLRPLLNQNCQEFATIGNKVPWELKSLIQGQIQI